jgi:hypothetical protein
MHKRNMLLDIASGRDIVRILAGRKLTVERYAEENFDVFMIQQ